MKRLFDPVTLQLFIAVCEERNIGRAGEREAIVASAISKRIAALEQELGVSLLLRGRRGIEPTPAGEALLRQARSILSMMERAQVELSEFGTGVIGSVRVLASLSALSEFLPEDVARFLGVYQSIRVSLEERVTPEVVKGVREGQADFGVCWDAGDLDGLETLKYRSDQLCVAIHPSHPLFGTEPIAFAQILEHELVDILVGSILHTLMQRFAAIAGMSLRFRIQVTTVDAALRIVAARLGIAVVPREMAGALAQTLGLSLRALSDPWARRQFVICTRAGGALSATARLLVNFLCERANASTPHPS